MRWVLAAAVWAALATAVTAGDAARARATRGHQAAEARLARAQTLHVRVQDGLARGAVTEHWFRAPNRFRVHYPDGRRAYCDGKTLVTVAAGGERSAGPAPRAVPEDYRLGDFAAFFERRALPGKVRSLEEFSFGGVTRRVWWVQTSESAIFFGMLFLDAKTFLPVGHRTTEYAEVVTSDYYSLVRLDEKLPDSHFAPPPPPGR